MISENQDQISLIIQISSAIFSERIIKRININIYIYMPADFWEMGRDTERNIQICWHVHTLHICKTYINVYMCVYIYIIYMGVF